MAWWGMVFKRGDRPPLAGQAYRVAVSLFSKDGNRAAEVREFRSGEVYLLEQERVDETPFKDRHGGRLVGPFASAEEAERFIGATRWFRGDEP